MNRPEINEYAPYYQGYIDLVEGDNFLTKLAKVNDYTIALLATVPESRSDYAYADGKWTIKELVMHLCDTERVFQYRALSFARMDPAPLPGFDHDAWVPAAEAHLRTLPEVAAEYRSVRQASITLFSSFGERQLLQKGKANGLEMSVRALGFVVVGHELHHRKILQERYLTGA